MRTQRKVNKYILKTDYVIGYTSNTNKEFYIDIEDYENVKKYCWREDAYGYVVTSRNRKNIKLHKLLTQTSEEQIIDHINNNPLDNRKSNLRICNMQQNVFNSRTSKNNTSGFKGVYWDKSRNKWEVKIGINYKNVHLGRFDNKEDAIKTRLEAEKRLFGEYSNVDWNDPDIISIHEELAEETARIINEKLEKLEGGLICITN